MKFFNIYSKALVFMFLINCISCNERIEKIEIEKYNNGNFRFIKKYHNKVLNGEAIWFYPSGNIEQKVIFREGKENGHAYYFYLSGALKSHRYWKNGNMIGFVADYWDDTMGIIKSSLYFNDNGDLIYKKNFDKIGKVISEVGRKPN